MEMATGTNEKLPSGGLLSWVASTNNQVIKTVLQPDNYLFISLMGKIKFLAQALNYHRHSYHIHRYLQLVPGSSFS